MDTGVARRFLAAIVAPLALIGCDRDDSSVTKTCNSNIECPGGTYCSLSTRTCVEPPEPPDALAMGDVGLDAGAGADAAADATGGVPCEGEGPCDDGDPCTNGDECADGLCAGTPYSCDDDGIDCTVGACDGNGGCDYGIAAGKCLIGGQCVDAGTDPDEPCRQCVPALSQTEWQVSDGEPCDDGDPCTEGDTCAGGACEATPITCDTSGDTACLTTACNPESGACEQAEAADGAPCDDGDLCTEGDGCIGGVCEATPVTCDTSDDTACLVTACDPEIGACEQAAVEDGAPCDDGIATTDGDQCIGGVCVGDDASCSCEADADCEALDDDNLCNGALACDGCHCFVDPETIVTCPTDGDNECEAAACDPATGECSVEPLEDGTPCDDEDPDTSDDACLGGACIGSQQ